MSDDFKNGKFKDDYDSEQTTHSEQTTQPERTTRVERTEKSQGGYEHVKGETVVPGEDNNRNDGFIKKTIKKIPVWIVTHYMIFAILLFLIDLSSLFLNKWGIKVEDQFHPGRLVLFIISILYLVVYLVLGFTGVMTMKKNHTALNPFQIRPHVITVSAVGVSVFLFSTFLGNHKIPFLIGSVVFLAGGAVWSFYSKQKQGVSTMVQAEEIFEEIIVGISATFVFYLCFLVLSIFAGIAIALIYGAILLVGCVFAVILLVGHAPYEDDEYY